MLRDRVLRDWLPWDTYNPRSAFGTEWLQTVLNNLVEIVPSEPSRVRPDLAESWSFSGDGKVLTFNLHEGVTWHDGKPFTAEDVVWNLTEGRDNLKRGWNAQKLRPITKVEAVDEKTVRITLADVNASFLHSLGVAHILMYAPHRPVDKLPELGPLGTGPFKFKSFQADKEIVVERNPDYFKRDEAGRPLPFLDGIRFAVITSNDTAFAALRTQRLDCDCGYDFITPKGKELLKEFPEMKLIFRTAESLAILYKNAPPFDNKLVRQATSYALDLKAINTATRGGTGVFPPTYLLPQELGGKWALPTKEYLAHPGYAEPKEDDIRLSKSLFEQAGFDPSGKTLRVIRVVGASFYQDTMETLDAELRKQGWTVDLQLQIGPRLNEKYARGEFEIAFFGGGRTFDDPNERFTSFITTNGNENFGKWSFPELDRMAAEQSRTLDVAKRQQIVFEMQRFLLDEAFFWPLVPLGATVGTRGEIEGYQPGRFSVNAGHRRETIWINR